MLRAVGRRVLGFARREVTCEGRSSRGEPFDLLHEPTELGVLRRSDGSPTQRDAASCEGASEPSHLVATKSVGAVAAGVR